jgi:hypothetical protein
MHKNPSSVMSLVACFMLNPLVLNEPHPRATWWLTRARLAAKNTHLLYPPHGLWPPTHTVGRFESCDAMVPPLHSTGAAVRLSAPHRHIVLVPFSTSLESTVLTANLGERVYE